MAYRNTDSARALELTGIEPAKKAAADREVAMRFLNDRRVIAAGEHFDAALDRGEWVDYDVSSIYRDHEHAVYRRRRIRHLRGGVAVTDCRSGRPSGTYLVDARTLFARGLRAFAKVATPVARGRSREVRSGPRRRRGSRRGGSTSRGDPDDADSDSSKPSGLRLWRHPRWGRCSPDLIDALAEAGR